MDSTAGLSRGEEIIPTPVFVGGQPPRTARWQDSGCHDHADGQSGRAAEGNPRGRTGLTTPPQLRLPHPNHRPERPTAMGSGLRMWYDKTGSFSVEALLLQTTETEVVLRRADGKVIRVPKANLSEADQRYLRQKTSLAVIPICIMVRDGMVPIARSKLDHGLDWIVMATTIGAVPSGPLINSKESIDDCFLGSIFKYLTC